MSIQIGGTTVIDNNQNFNVGVATIGSGNSSITLNNFSTKLGIGITFDNISSHINASAGIITAAGISFPLGLG